MLGHAALELQIPEGWTVHRVTRTVLSCGLPPLLQPVSRLANVSPTMLDQVAVALFLLAAITFVYVIGTRE
jgi:hypothetical protein